MNKWRRLHKIKEARSFAARRKHFTALRSVQCAMIAACGSAQIRLIAGSDKMPHLKIAAICEAALSTAKAITLTMKRFQP